MASGGTVIESSSAAIVAQGAFLNATFSSGGEALGGDGRLLAASNASTVNLSATDGGVLAGDAIADATSTVHIALVSEGSWYGSAQNVTSVDIDSSGLWRMIDSSTVQGNAWRQRDGLISVAEARWRRSHCRPATGP